MKDTIDEIHFGIGDSSLGSFLVAESGRGVCAILFGANPRSLARDLGSRFPEARLIDVTPGRRALLARVGRFIENPALGLDLPLDLRGTAFQRKVWEALRNLRCGQTVSYRDIATQIGFPAAVRAVAGACAANALAVAIPCHRVVRSDGALSGYRWGIERKRILLEREARA